MRTIGDDKAGDNGVIVLDRQAEKGKTRLRHDSRNMESKRSVVHKSNIMWMKVQKWMTGRQGGVVP